MLCFFRVTHPWHGHLAHPLASNCRHTSTKNANRYANGLPPHTPSTLMSNVSPHPLSSRVAVGSSSLLTIERRADGPSPSTPNTMLRMCTNEVSPSTSLGATSTYIINPWSLEIMNTARPFLVHDNTTPFQKHPLCEPCIN